MSDFVGVINKPYVGISGVANADEAEAVLSLIEKSGFGMSTGHVPMLGFQVSWKSLEFGFSEGNYRVPRLQSLPRILAKVDGKVFSTLHYYTKNPDKLVEEVVRVLANGDIYRNGLVGGLQLNGGLPSHSQLEQIHGAYPNLDIVLQLSPNVLETMTLDAAVRSIASSGDTVNHVIIDWSRGQGIEHDTDQIMATYRMLRAGGVMAGMVFAGGFSGDNVVAKVGALKRAIGSKSFSIDAEGGLRRKIGEGYGNDLLDLRKVDAYLAGAAASLLR